MAQQYSYDQLTAALANAGRRARANPNDTRARKAAQHFASMIENKEYEEESAWYHSAAQGIAQGATFGLHDEMSAGVRAALLDPAVSAIFGKGVGGVSGLDDYLQNMGARYDKALESQREAVETARREDPYITMAGELVGGLAVPGAAAARGLKGAQTTGQAIKRSAATAAGTGAVAGYGYSEADPFRVLVDAGLDEKTTEEFKQAATDVIGGAAGGAVVGTAIPGGAALGKSLLSSVKNAFAPGARLTEKGRREIMDQMALDIQAGFIKDEKEALDILKDTPGMSMADLGPNLRRLLKDITTSGTAAGTEAAERVRLRNQEQWKRIIPRMSKIIGSDSSYYKSMTAMQKQTEQKAAEMYDKAYSQVVEITPEMFRIMKQPFKKALKEANAIRKAEGKPPIEKNLKIGQVRSTKDIDDIVQTMDDLVTAGYKKRYRLGSTLKQQRELFKEQVYDQNRFYEEARKTYGTNKSREEMMEMGSKIFSKDADMVEEMFEDMSQGDRDYYLMGMMGAIKKQLKWKPEDADIVKGLFNIPGRAEIMESVIGDPKKFGELVRFVKNEQKMFETYKKTLNSDTAENLMRAQTDQQGRIASMIAFMGTKSLLLSGMAGRAARLAGRYRGPAPAEQFQRAQQAEMMLGGVEGLQRAMQRPGGLLAPGPMPTPGVAATGLMATGIPQAGVEYGGY